MIRPIDIRLNAAHPELKLPEAVTYTGSPSTVLVRGVPPNYGRWAITAVSVAATFPDGSTTTRAAVQSANGVWVATLPATATSGRTTDGFRVLADGIDENGEVVTGYIIAVADFAVASLDVTPAPEPGETSWQMLYFDAVPSTLRKGDVAKVDGVPKLYNGTAWEAFAAPVTFDDAVTRTSANSVKSSGIWSAIWGALSALPTGFTSLYDWVMNQLAGKEPLLGPLLISGSTIKTVSAIVKNGSSLYPIGIPTSDITVNGQPLSSDVALTGADITVSGTDATKIDAALAGKATKADATLAERGFSAWEVTPATFQGLPIEIRWVDATQYGFPGYSWEPFAGSLMLGVKYAPNENATTFYCASTISEVGGPISATRTALQGYRLGPDEESNPNRDKPLASEAEAEALRQDKQNALSTQQLANIAAVPNKANNADVVHTTGAETIAGTKTFTSNIIVSTGNKQVAYGSSIFVSGGATIGFPAESGTLALTADLRYSLTTKTIDNGAVTLDDRAINAVAVSSSLASLTINFPTATSGRARDFGLRLTVASGITTAPQVVLPQGVSCENADGEAPEIGADGAATILYFTETASGVFLVKGEVLQTITA